MTSIVVNGSELKKKKKKGQSALLVQRFVLQMRTNGVLVQAGRGLRDAVRLLKRTSYAAENLRLFRSTQVSFGFMSGSSRVSFEDGVKGRGWWWWGGG